MSIVSDKDVIATHNSIEELQAFISSPEATHLLGNTEYAFLSGVCRLVREGSVDAPKLIALSGIDDPQFGNYPGGGEVNEAVKKMYTAGVEIQFFIQNRPNLFFYKPETKQSFLFKNPGSGSSEHLQVFDFQERCWKQIDDLSLFEGAVDEDDCPQYDQLIKANDLMICFNQAATAKDKIPTVYGEETIRPQESGQLYYHEEQTSGFCQIHALNAFVGYKAVQPSGLQEFVTAKSKYLGQENITGLAKGAEEASEAVAAEEKSNKSLFNIENGVDLGMILDYVYYLSNGNELKIDVKNLQVGSMKMVGEELTFCVDSTGESYKIDQSFLSSKDRILFGTVRPAHAQTLRKNLDGTWVLIDSFESSQPSKNPIEFLTKIMNEQKALLNEISLPIVFL